jgi:hypothetical protein
VRFWVAQARPISRNASKRIEQLVRDKHSDQMRRLRGFYLEMVAGLSGTAIRGRLMTIDLASLRLDDELRRAALSTVVAFPPSPSAGRLDDELRRAALSTVVAFPPSPSAGLPPGDQGSASLTTSSAAA